MATVSDSEVVQWVRSLVATDVDPVAAGTVLGRLAQAGPDALGPLLATLAEDTEAIANGDPAILGALALAAQRLAANERSSGQDQTDSPAEHSPLGQAVSGSKLAAESRPGADGSSASDPDTRHALSFDPADIYDIVLAFPPRAGNRFRLMYLLAQQRSAASLATLARILMERPPSDWKEVGQILSPLLLNDDWESTDLFPAVLEALTHRAVASPVLDLANYLTRQGRVTEHPGAACREMLATLLGAVADRLGEFEDNPRAFGETVDEVQSVLSEAVALAVSLCDALGLIGWHEAEGKLNKALGLRHRRVQCEAAGALARLGIDAGREHLLALVAEPSARLRVIAYADELGFGDQIDPTYRTDISCAEAELALWLASPEQMGVSPTSVEVIDSRLQFWPGYEEAIDCYLVRFEYQFGDRAYSNVGITGPVVFATGADVADLPIEDIYAIYAGWHVQHPEIFVIDSEKWNSAQRRLASPLLEELDRRGFEMIEPRALGFFLDEHALLAVATRDETACVVVTDGLETIDFATQGRQRPLSIQDAWHLYLGRKMLRTFN